MVEFNGIRAVYKIRLQMETLPRHKAIHCKLFSAAFYLDAVSFLELYSNDAFLNNES